MQTGNVFGFLAFIFVEALVEDDEEGEVGGGIEENDEVAGDDENDTELT
jgi:hypothetical protein